MINFLHTYNPTPILISFGPINVYWYGLFIVTGILVAILVILKLAGYYQIEKNIIIDSVFYLIIGGIIGARLFHVILEFPFYWQNPINIFKLWQGGLAIHGAIIAGLAITWYLAKKSKINFWQLTAIYVPGLAIAQAVGRWGNYFNQELFGKPTNLPWSVPIETANRLPDYYNNLYFHPTFLYESLGNLIIFITLLAIHYFIIKKIICGKKFPATCYVFCVLCYLTLYSILRFVMESIRIDRTPEFLGLRLPQITSLLITALTLGILYYYKHHPEALEKNSNS